MSVEGTGGSGARVAIAAGLALFVFAAGLVTGLVIANSSDNGAGPPVIISTRGPSTTATVQSADAPRDARPTVAPTPVETAPSRTHANTSPTSRGVGRMTASLRLADGTPVAGVRVVARRNPSDRLWDRSSGEAHGLTIEEVVEATRERERVVRESAVEATSDESGALVFDGLVDAFYGIELVDRGYESRSRRWGGRPGAHLDLIVAPQCYATFGVRYVDGSVPEKAVIRLSVNGSARGHKDWTPEEPTVNVRAGTYDVQALIGKSNEVQSIATTLTFAPGTPVEHDFVVGDRPALLLLLPDDQLRTLGGVDVYVMKAGDGVTITEEMLVTEGRRVPLEPRSRTFDQALHDLSPGVVAIGATRRGDRVLETFEHITLGRGLTTYEIPLPAPDRSDHVHVRVIAPSGLVVTEGVRLTMAFDGEEQRASDSSWSHVVMAGGWRALRHVDAWYAGTSDGPFVVSAYSEALGSGTGEYVRGPSPAVEIQLTPLPYATVRVSGYVGSRREGRVRLALSAENSQPVIFGSDQYPAPNLEGVATLKALVPGHHRLCLYLEETSGHRMAKLVAIRDVTLVPGENTFEIAVPDLHTIRVEGAESLVILTMSGLEHWTAHAAPRESGAELLVEGIPPGRYVVRSPGHESFEISVPETTLIRF